MKTGFSVSLLAVAFIALAGALAPPAVEAAASTDKVLYSGTFDGRSNHAVSGSVRVVQRGGRTLVVLGEDFRFDGAPDPKLGFSVDRRKPRALFALLQSKRGEQIYALPAGFDATQLDGLNLWCERFGVQLGYAALD